MCDQATESYTGTENLEVMKDAINYNRFLIDLVVSYCQPSDRIVDFGAGVGTYAGPMRQRGYDLICIESDNVLCQRLLDQGLSTHADIAELDDASVDFIYTLNVLEHIEDDRAALQLLHSKLKLGGVLLVYVPAFQCLYTSMDKKIGHYRRYSRNSFERLLPGCNFSVIRCEYVDSLGFFATLLYMAIGDNRGSVNKRMLIAYDRLVFPLSRLLDLGLSCVMGKNLLVVMRRQG
ncbi:MAG: class I SAM-dependent methyltransferase [Rhodospirillaceae bacterium]